MRLTALIFSSLLLLAACSGGYERAAAPTPASAEVSIVAASSGVLTSIGDTRSLSARVLAADGQVVASPQVAWSSSAPAVATVAGTGSDAVVTATGNGTALITARSGAVEYTIGVTVRQAVTAVVISRPLATLEPGATMKLSAVAQDARGHDIPGITSFTFSSSDTRLVIVQPDGEVTGLVSQIEDPTATIVAAVTRDGITTTGSTRVRVEQVEPFDFRAILTPGSVKPSPVFTSGEGAAWFGAGNGIASYVVAWNGLSGAAAAVHIHGAADAGSVAGILVDLPLPRQDAVHGALRGSFTAGDIRSLDGAPPISVDSLVILIVHGQVYVDVHTAAHPEGEIRGQAFWPSF